MGVTTHGLSASPTYKVWQAMHQRCGNLNNPGFHRYGGRGIKVCDRWNSFENFLADMGEKPAGMFIERVDNDGDYEPSNCRWATRSEQQRNRRNNRVVTHAGVTLCLKDWALRVGMPPNTLYGRLDKGWDFERAITAPPVMTGRPKRQAV